MQAFPNETFYEWWDREESTNHYRGVTETLDYLLRFDKEYGPFDGVMGFSQGAGVATLCCALKQAAEAGETLPPSVLALLPPSLQKNFAPLPSLRCGERGEYGKPNTMHSSLLPGLQSCARASSRWIRACSHSSSTASSRCPSSRVGVRLTF